MHLRHLRIRSHKKSTQETSNGHTETPGISGVNQSSKQLTAQEIEQRRLIHQYIFSKLETYANKPRIWQLTHSSRLKQRLLDKSRNISNLYSLPNDFVNESINQLFIDVDKNVLQLRKLIQSTSHESVDPNVLFQQVRKSNNQWRSLQMGRAKQIFPDINNEDYTESELLQKYYNHVIETLTPKADTKSVNCIAQLREQPFDLNQAYEQAERKAKGYLSHMLESYRERSIPDLQIIQEMVDIGKVIRSKIQNNLINISI